MDDVYELKRELYEAREEVAMLNRIIESLMEERVQMLADYLKRHPLDLSEND